MRTSPHTSTVTGSASVSGSHRYIALDRAAGDLPGGGVAQHLRTLRHLVKVLGEDWAFTLSAST
ncbi:hypothetical protein [Streptomyces sp. NPDC093060]|uniref:hypothetical protein n=1 Tax=Streptomyces sp. NPDC093060 TaxID=3366019 RepID=UPI00382EECF0